MKALLKSLQFCSLILAFFFSATAFAESYISNSVASIETFIDHQKLTALSETSEWDVGEILPVISKNAKLGVVGFVEVISVKPISGRNFELRLKLIRQSRRYFVQTGDIIRRMDLSTANDDYIGTTDLVIRNSHMNISSKYRPLVYQGFGIGDTAQTLYKGELLVNYFGNLFYGFNDWLTLGTLAPVNVLGKPNATFRAKFYDSESTTLATGLSFVRLVQEDQATLNLNFFWDSTSSDSLITHTFIGLGLVRWDKAADAAAIKALGSSSFQTGYEVILDSWNRFLVGPNYNFEKKALGGYVSYVWIQDRFHAQISVNATDVTSLRLDPTNGYYGFFDLYWRF